LKVSDVPTHTASTGETSAFASDIKTIEPEKRFAGPLRQANSGR
jgi:hypothetical protein